MLSGGPAFQRTSFRVASGLSFDKPASLLTGPKGLSYSAIMEVGLKQHMWYGFGTHFHNLSEGDRLLARAWPCTLATSSPGRLDQARRHQLGAGARGSDLWRVQDAACCKTKHVRGFWILSHGLERYPQRGEVPETLSGAWMGP